MACLKYIRCLFFILFVILKTNFEACPEIYFFFWWIVYISVVSSVMICLYSSTLPPYSRVTGISLYAEYFILFRTCFLEKNRNLAVLQNYINISKSETNQALLPGHFISRQAKIKSHVGQHNFRQSLASLILDARTCYKCWQHYIYRVTLIATKNLYLRKYSCYINEDFLAFNLSI